MFFRQTPDDPLFTGQTGLCRQFPQTSSGLVRVSGQSKIRRKLTIIEIGKYQAGGFSFVKKRRRLNVSRNGRVKGENLNSLVKLLILFVGLRHLYWFRGVLVQGDHVLAGRILQQFIEIARRIFSRAELMAVWLKNLCGCSES